MALGFRKFTVADEGKIAAWLASEVCPIEVRDEPLREAVVVWCEAEKVQLPTRVDRIVGSARSLFEDQFCERTVSRLSRHSRARLEALVSEQGLLVSLKTDPGKIGLDTMLTEIEKLSIVRAIGL